MSLLEYHVLLALASAPLHGYAIKDIVAEESGGSLMTVGYVTDAEPKGAEDAHPGLARKYYALTSSGRAALAAEARRLKQAVAMAEKRLGIARSRS